MLARRVVWFLCQTSPPHSGDLIWCWACVSGRSHRSLPLPFNMAIVCYIRADRMSNFIDSWIYETKRQSLHSTLFDEPYLWTSGSRRCNSTISVMLWNHWPLKTCQSCHACITVLFGFSCCHFRWNKFSLSGAILLKAKKITPCLKGFNYWEIIPKFQQNERAGLKLVLSTVGRIRNDLIKFGKVS